MRKLCEVDTDCKNILAKSKAENEKGDNMAKLTPEQYCLNLDTSLGCQYRGKPCPQAVIEYVKDDDSSMWGSQRFEIGAKCGLTETPLTFGKNISRPRAGGN